MGNCCGKNDDDNDVKGPSGSWLKHPDTVTDGFPSTIHFTIGVSDLSVLVVEDNTEGQKREHEVQENTEKKTRNMDSRLYQTALAKEKLSVKITRQYLYQILQ